MLLITHLFVNIILECLLNCVPTWSRALCAYVLTCPRALHPYMLKCLGASCVYVLTCLRAFCAYMLTYQRLLRAYGLTCQRALGASRPYVPTCSRAIAKNNKNEVSIICFTYILVITLSFLVLWKKSVIQFCIALIKCKPLAGAMTNFVQ